AGALQGADLGDDVGQRGAAFGAVVPIAERREQCFELVPRGGEGGGGGGGHGGSRVGVRVSRTHTRALRRPCQPGEGRRLRGRAGTARRPSGSARRGGMTGPDDTAAALAAAGAYRRLAEQALADRPLAREGARALLGSPDEDLPAVLWAAFAARSRHFGRRVKLCVLQNARSGLCPEDCGYCSQSAVSTADIRRYRLLPVADLVAGARRAAATGAGRYCMVTSARAPSASGVAHFARAARPAPAAADCLRALALFRLTSPRAEIRAAGGRERALGAAQGLALFAANSIFVEGYLTTPGQRHADALAMIHALGFEVEGEGRRAMDRTAQM